MDKIMELYKKYKDIIMYIIFGVLTTLVNFCSFFILTKLHLFGAELDTVINTTIAWFLSVAFAYFTNRKWVFESKVTGVKAILLEAWSFLACRIATGVMDVVIMYVFVDVCGMKSDTQQAAIKLMSNVLVIILNYVGSKLIVFRDKSKTGGKSGEK